MEDVFMQIRPYLIALFLAAAANYAAGALDKILSALADQVIKLQKWLDEKDWLKKMRIDNLITQRIHEAIIIVKDEYVDDIREASKDGKLTKAEAAVATGQAYEKFCEVLSATEKSELLSVFGDDLQNFIMARIPALVQYLKPEAAADIGNAVGEILEVADGDDPR